MRIKLTSEFEARDPLRTVVYPAGTELADEAATAAVAAGAEHEVVTPEPKPKLAKIEKPNGQDQRES